MFSFWRHRLFRQTWHPSFEELMLHLDGESVPKGGRVGTHTKNCWSCRLRLEKIDHAISEFMESRNATFAGPPALPRQALQNFAARLDRLDNECGSPRLFLGLVREYTEGLFTQGSSRRLAIFLASLCLIVVVFVRLNLPQPVSAKEILFQVRQAEARQMMQVSAPVIYEKFQLSSTSRRLRRNVPESRRGSRSAAVSLQLRTLAAFGSTGVGETAAWHAARWRQSNDPQGIRTWTFSHWRSRRRRIHGARSRLAPGGTTPFGSETGRDRGLLAW